MIESLKVKFICKIMFGRAFDSWYFIIYWAFVLFLGRCVSDTSVSCDVLRFGLSLQQYTFYISHCNAELWLYNKLIDLSVDQWFNMTFGFIYYGGDPIWMTSLAVYSVYIVVRQWHAVNDAHLFL